MPEVISGNDTWQYLVVTATFYHNVDDTVFSPQQACGLLMSVKTRYPHLIEMDEDTGRELIVSMAEIARQNGMALRMCANPELDIPQSQCCGVELFAPYGTDVLENVSGFKPGPSRASCRCLKTVGYRYG